MHSRYVKYFYALNHLVWGPIFPSKRLQKVGSISRTFPVVSALMNFIFLRTQWNDSTGLSSNAFGFPSGQINETGRGKLDNTAPAFAHKTLQCAITNIPRAMIFTRPYGVLAGNQSSIAFVSGDGDWVCASIKWKTRWEITRPTQASPTKNRRIIYLGPNNVI